MKLIIQNHKKLLHLFILTTFIITLISCSKSETAEPQINNDNNMGTTDEIVTPESGLTAPNFVLRSLDGDYISLSDFEDKVVVLFFFGNHCSLCMASGAEVENEIHKRFKDNSSFAILGLDQWDGNSQAVENFKTTSGITFPLLLNASAVTADYETTYDRLVIIDKSRNIQYTGSLPAVREIDIVIPIIEDLLN